jgi:hypothetical protein
LKGVVKISYLNSNIEILDYVINYNRDYIFKEEDKFNKLEELAYSLISKNTVEGYISSIFIFHQLIENWLDYLIDSYNYYFRVRLFPLETRGTFKIEKYFRGKYETLRQAPDFSDNKECLLALLEDINVLRNKFGHNLLSFEILKEDCENLKELYESIIELCEEEESSIDSCIGDCQKSIRGYLPDCMDELILIELDEEHYTEYLTKSNNEWYKYVKGKLGNSVSYILSQEIKNILIENVEE